MNNLILRSSTNVAVGDKPIVILPLDMYEKLTKSLYSFKNTKISVKKSEKDFLITAGESSLSKDWLKPAEEKVWQNL